MKKRIKKECYFREFFKKNKKECCFREFFFLIARTNVFGRQHKYIRNNVQWHSIYDLDTLATLS